MPEESKKKKNLLVYNLLFIAVCGGIFLFLWNAPRETTPHLPHDEKHNQYIEMDKKEAEKHCGTCHGEGEGKMPLPKDHPPTYRCLFCHKRT
ncbi:hypothetical protein VU07_03630 [Desulfobulbus sp. F4]|nr:hypothetical protein [Desulfobulbus sp. F3]MCW5200879.1 hypothetical protein [Desulfobulbus sp. F4]